jgi:hypothetical protein
MIHPKGHEHLLRCRSCARYFVSDVRLALPMCEDCIAIALDVLLKAR